MNAQPETRWPRPVRWADLDDAGRRELLRRPVLDAGDRRGTVRGILAEVRTRGDAALAGFTQRFDGYQPGTEALPIEVDPDEVAAAAGQVRTGVLDAMDRAAARIEAFHAADRPRDRALDTAPGLNCRVRYLPLSPVGLYVPGGSAPLLSTVLMLAIPARIAGCAEVVLCTPADREGQVA
ncbi:MAG: histidinol dehydrogenase, partial [Xanthomonadales bacterium]|nr:histidinol dehydrogenase [Xanthomonadales bacterium]